MTGPRYTSYPAAVQFDTNFDPKDLHKEFKYSKFLDKTGLHTPEKYPSELYQLDNFATDGLLIQTLNGLHITEIGRLFLRNITMFFDEYLKGARKKIAYSKTV